jgi:CheY-like chemotaxis protein
VRKILFLEDDFDALAVGIGMLEKVGRVFPACLADEARRHMSEHRFDLLVTDLHLRHEWSIDFMEEFKALNPYSPIILVTAFAKHGGLESRLKPLVFETLRKPFSSEEIWDLAREAIDLTFRPVFSLPLSPSISRGLSHHTGRPLSLISGHRSSRWPDRSALCTQGARPSEARTAARGH